MDLRCVIRPLGIALLVATLLTPAASPATAAERPCRVRNVTQDPGTWLRVFLDTAGSEERDDEQRTGHR